MIDLNNNKKEFNLPSYINIPFFLYQDDRLDKTDLLIAAFFYSLHTSGKKLTASTDYLCQLVNVKKRRLYYILNHLENCNYIRRSGFTNRKKITWIYTPGSNITITENEQIVEEPNTSALQDTSVEELNTSALQCTKLVHSNALNYCTPVHTYNKDNNKDNKELTTVKPEASSSSFFSEKQSKDLMTFKLVTDERSDELFLENCQHHIEKQTNNLSKFQRVAGLRHILIKIYETGEHFKSSGFIKNSVIQEVDNRIPKQEDFQQYKSCVRGYEWVGSWMQKQRNNE